MTIHQRIRDLSAGHTNTEIERAIGAKNGTVGKWLKGYNLPSIEYIPALARFFGVTTDYLLGLSDTTSEHERLLIDAFRAADAEGQQEIIYACRKAKRLHPRK